jgi:ATP-binding cassette subfamily B protein
MQDKSKGIIKELFFLVKKLSKRRRIQLVLIIVLSFFSAIFEIISLAALIPFLEILNDDSSSFNEPIINNFILMLKDYSGNDFSYYLTLIFVGVTILSGVFRFILLWIQTRVTHLIGADISIMIYSKSIYQPYSSHIKKNSSDIIASISTKVDRLVRDSLVSVLLVISSGLMSVSLICFLFYIEPVVALGSFGSFGFIYLVIILLSKKFLKRNSKAINHYQNLVFKALSEGFGGMKDIVINRSQEFFINKYRSSDIPMRRAHANIAIIGGAPRFALEALGFTTFALIAFILKNNGYSGAETTSILALFAISSMKIIPLLQQIYAGISSISGSRFFLYDINDFLSLEIHDPKNIKPINFNSEIKIDNVSFRFSENDEWILKDFSTIIPSGKMVGIIGSTGSGKSTLLNIIMGLLTPNVGNLKIDNELIDENLVLSWRKKIAYVPQEIFLNDSSIYENIALGVESNEIDHDRVKKVSKSAMIYNDIISWSDGFKTKVGERGVNISGGQKQRIGLARALYRQPELLILDEATSALDYKTEREVMNAVESLSKNLTVIIVAHRLETLKNCDMVIELKNNYIK